MSAFNNKSQHYKTIKKTCYSANAIYLFIHVFYLVLFLVAKLYVMAYISAAAVLCYGLLYLVLAKKKYYL